MEIWMPSIGEYDISNLGDLSRNGQLIKTRIDKYGYKIATLSVNGEHLTRKIHRLVALAFIPNLENKPQVNHIGKDENGCIDKLDNRAISLEWATSAENMQHGYANDLFQEGSEKATAKLNEQNVAAIKQLIVDGYGNSEIGHKFGVTCGAIYSIRKDDGWQHVPWPAPYKYFESHNRTKIEGSNSSASKLNEIQVIEIKKKLKEGASISELVAEFGISGGAMRCIRNDTTWKHVVID